MLKRFIFRYLLVCLSALLFTTARAADWHISLSGTWSFEMDLAGKGISEKWFERDLRGNISLPGTLQAQGFGEDITGATRWTSDAERNAVPQFSEFQKSGTVKIPFWLQPDKYYVGPAWYARDIIIPAEWAGKRILLTLERPHWESRVWIDGQAVGTNDSLFTPHVYDLGTALTEGKHRLTIRITNEKIIDIGRDAHGIGDHTQGNWNGIAGRIDLSATSPVFIADVQIYPNVQNKSARFVVNIGNAANQAGKGTLIIGKEKIPVQWNVHGATVEAVVPLAKDAQPWDEFNPALQRMKVALNGPNADDQREITFGLREVTAREAKLELNGREIFLRGTHDGGQFPLLGHPAMDVDSWKRIFSICKDHGFNYVRFHSWCPPDAAFSAADAMGMYLRPEIAWAPGQAILKITPWLDAETKRILRTYGNHPSFLMMTPGNEMGSTPEVVGYLTQWTRINKENDSRHIYAGAAGYPATPANDFLEEKLRGSSGWKGKDYAKGYENAIKNLSEGSPKPVLVHELGQWCAYPNFREISHYTGPFKPKNFEIFRASLQASGMLNQAQDFLIASGKLQALCDKEEIEATLRTKGIAGFDLLDLHDFPGQGTALVGVLNALWESKGYISPGEFRRFCAPTVPLVRLTKTAWLSNEHFSAAVEIAHFGAAPLMNAEPYWKILDAWGKEVLSGKLPAHTIELGQGTPLGQVEFALNELRAPAQYRLVVGLTGKPVENDWHFWVYPEKTETPAHVLVAAQPDDTLISQLNTGARVLLIPSITKDLPTRFPVGSWKPVFWNRQWFPEQRTETLGLLIDAKHPALADFPTDFYSDWQWENIVENSRSMLLTGLPSTLKPIVQTIDDWNTNRRLAVVVEAKIGKGAVVICTADLATDLDKRPEARQLRASLLRYLASSRCNPETSLTVDQLKTLTTRNVVPMPPCKVTADNTDPKGKYSPQALVDGDVLTGWCTTEGTPAATGFPHWIQLEFDTPQCLSGIAVVPKQQGAIDGNVKDYIVQTSEDGKNWCEAAKGAATPGKQETCITFPAVTAKFVKFVALSPATGYRAHLSLSEIWLIGQH